MVRVVFETTPENRRLLRLLSAHRGQDQKDVLVQMIQDAAKKEGLYDGDTES